MCLAELSLPHREVLTLRFLEGLEIAEVAEVVRCNLGTAKSRLHYASKRFNGKWRNSRMSNIKNKTFSQLLVKQDEPVSESQFKEYRMHLEQKLASAARFERRVRIMAIAAWSVSILLPLALRRYRSNLPRDAPHAADPTSLPIEIHALPGALGTVGGVVYMVTITFAWLIVLWYLIKSRPALYRAVMSTRQASLPIFIANWRRSRDNQTKPTR